jgi:hypothetical protein
MPRGHREGRRSVAFDNLIAIGEATPAQGDLLDLPTPEPSNVPGPPLSELLEEMRADTI